MGQQPQTRRSIRDRERHQHAVTILAVVAAVAVLGTAAWVGTALSTSSSPTAAPGRTTGVGALGSALVSPSTSARPSPAVSGSAPATQTNGGPSESAAAPAAPSGGSKAASSAAGATATASATTTVMVGPAVQALAACRTAWNLRSAAAAAADRSLRQWQGHLEIMNDLQAGRISLATAKAQWPSTTDRAEQNVAAFRAADRALDASTATCATSPSAAVTTNAALTRCAAATDSVDAVLARARTAIAPWEEHLADQSHFKAGGMTAAMAEAAWRVMWRKGLATLPPYLDAARQARGATCTLPTSP